MMPHRARLVIAGIPWHIIQRGNNRSACFYADEDYRFYLETLREQAEKYGCELNPVRAGMDLALIGKIKDATNGNFALGNRRFSQEIAQALMRRVAPGRAGRPKMKSGKA